jgi:hypothetical protein
MDYLQSWNAKGPIPFAERRNATELTAHPHYRHTRFLKKLVLTWQGNCLLLLKIQYRDTKYRRRQAHDQGGASVCNALTKNVVAATTNLSNTKDEHVDQPAERSPTPYLSHVLPPSICCGWEQSIFKNLCIGKMFFFVVIERVT